MLLVLLGGLALFLLGIARIAAGLNSAAGPATRRWMASATRSPFRALLTGTAVSAATQSGMATAVTALGLVASGLVAVREGIALGLGAKVGATLAIQLAAFDIAAYALPLIGVGYLLGLWRPTQHAGTFLLGAGFLFLGLDVAVGAVAELSGTPLFSLLIESAERQPFVVLVIGLALGALLSSSNAAAAVALGLFVAGAIGLPTAVALVVGGNAGATLLPVLAARTLDPSAKRVAITQALWTTLVAVLAVFFADRAADGLRLIGGDGARQVANLHTFFNVLAAVSGTLLAGPLARLSARFMPERDDSSAAPKYLREEALVDPVLGTRLAWRETVRISDQVVQMTELAAGFLRSGRWDAEPIAVREVKVDRLTQRIVDYLALLRARHGDDPATERLLLVATELEHMGDQVRRLQRREQRLRENGIEYSREGRAELSDTAEKVVERMRAAFTALASGDKGLAHSVVTGRQPFETHLAGMRVAHLARLEARMPDSRASSAHHLEVLTLLRQVDASSTRVAAWALEAAADVVGGSVPGEAAEGRGSAS